MKPDTVFKRAFNDALALMATLGDGALLPPEHAIGSALGVSRTTARKVIAELATRGAVEGHGSNRRVRLDGAVERYPEPETVSLSAQVERLFMEWMLRDDTRPGTMINELRA